MFITVNMTLCCLSLLVRNAQGVPVRTDKLHNLFTMYKNLEEFPRQNIQR